MEKQQIQKILESKFPPYNELTNLQQQELAENTIHTSYTKNQFVHGNNQECVGVLYILSGSLRVYMLSDEGREITLFRIKTDEFCILSASCILKDITFDVLIDAQEDTEVLIISTPFFNRLQTENIHIRCFAYQLATERFSDVMWAMQQILFMSMDKRLAVFLLDESASLGSDEISITHEQIARLTGSAREVISRMLKYFSSEGIVELYRGGIKLLDKKKLRDLAK